MLIHNLFLPAVGFAIGLSLGLLGGGGSILTVPALVYVLGQSPNAAVATSLAVVGINSAFGALFHHQKGNLNWKVALVFGSTGMIAAYFSAGLSALLPPAVLMVAFALLMSLAGLLMIIRPQQLDEGARRGPPHELFVAITGAGVGLLTGLLGVGGGFLIIPALVLILGLPMSQAVGTSLIIIAANSLAGFFGHMNFSGSGPASMLVFIAAGIAGSFAGARINFRLDTTMLRKLFAVFTLILAAFLLTDNLPQLIFNQ